MSSVRSIRRRMKRLQIREESKIIADSNQGDTTRDRENTSNDTCHTNNEENSRKMLKERPRRVQKSRKRGISRSQKSCPSGSDKATTTSLKPGTPSDARSKALFEKYINPYSEETRETLNEPLQKEYARLQKQLEKQWYDGVYKRYPYPLSEEEYGALSDEMKEKYRKFLEVFDREKVREGEDSESSQIFREREYFWHREIMTPEELERHYSPE